MPVLCYRPARPGRPAQLGENLGLALELQGAEANVEAEPATLTEGLTDRVALGDGVVVRLTGAPAPPLRHIPPASAAAARAPGLRRITLNK